MLCQLCLTMTINTTWAEVYGYAKEEYKMTDQQIEATTTFFADFELNHWNVDGGLDGLEFTTKDK